MEDGDTLRPYQQLGGGMALTEPGQKSQHVAQGRLLYEVLPVLCVSPVKNNTYVTLLNRWIEFTQYTVFFETQVPVYPGTFMSSAMQNLRV